MAWRLDTTVVRGELDSRVRGRVTGRIWLLDRPEPVELALEGNPYRDIAGCVLTFENPNPRHDEREDTNLNARQVGVVGDMTASRKIFALDVSIEEAIRLGKAGREIPKHPANCLYLEWHSTFNGRVVIESVGYRLQISEPAWTMSEDEEREQIRANGAALVRWMERLSAAVEGQIESDAGTTEPPLDEFAWERMLKDSDRRAEQFGEARRKYEGHPDAERLVAREMGWDWIDDALDAKEHSWVEEIEREVEQTPLVPDPETEGIDWIRAADGDIRHPLYHRSVEQAHAFWVWCKKEGLIEDGADLLVHHMLFEVHMCNAKLAGALNDLAYHERRDYGFLVAYLKRSLGYLHNALATCDQIAAKALIPAEPLATFRHQLMGVREGILGLMNAYRARLNNAPGS